MGKLSVVMATINDGIATNLTLAQVIYQLEQGGLDYEIILVDNGSDDLEKGELKSFLNFHKEFPIFYYEYDIKGTIPPHSFGVEKASGEYITMPDPHMVFSPDYFKVMLKTLKERDDAQVVFSPFSVGSMTKKGDDYIGESPLIRPNPFGKTNAIGHPCKLGDPPRYILSDTIASFITTKEWLLKIGNMFPKAFEIAGGHTAESLMIGITTWLFDGKCLLQPQVVVEHPNYRSRHGGGRNANAALSMATGSYILGGEKYLAEMPSIYGAYAPGQLESVPILSREAREYVLANQAMDLDYLVENWEEIKK